MNAEEVGRIRETIARLRSPDDIAELEKMAQSDTIAAALVDDGAKMARCLVIAEEAEAALEASACHLEAPRYRLALA
jgi:hypothetical protein